MSQRLLAERASISRSYLCDIERGRGVCPSVVTMEKLAVALGASRADLLRAAGLLEPVTTSQEADVERRILALFRDVSESARETIERFARFVHTEEHRWSQPLLQSFAEEEMVEANDVGMRRQRGPTLFDIDANAETLVATTEPRR
ncbi:MAG: helix-turn-helix domain-containing protein [Chloroflexota bacterium]|nr:helix-turn-helix domain-containing protein [Chloroflexota bacterium]